MLERIGLKPNWIYEVLMETGGLHRAPMGIWTENFETFIVDIYQDGSTYSNLKSSSFGSVYFIEDPKYFVETKDAKYFAKLDFKVVETLPGNPKRFICKVLKLDVLQDGEAINRGKSLFIEYLIDRSRRKTDENARKRYKYTKATIRKVAPGSVYDKLLEKKWKR